MTAAAIIFACIVVPMVIGYLAVQRWLEDRDHRRMAQEVKHG